MDSALLLQHDGWSRHHIPVHSGAGHLVLLLSKMAFSMCQCRVQHPVHDHVLWFPKPRQVAMAKMFLLRLCDRQYCLLHLLGGSTGCWTDSFQKQCLLWHWLHVLDLGWDDRTFHYKGRVRGWFHASLVCCLHLLCSLRHDCRAYILAYYQCRSRWGKTGGESADSSGFTEEVRLGKEGGKEGQGGKKG